LVVGRGGALTPVIGHQIKLRKFSFRSYNEENIYADAALLQSAPLEVAFGVLCLLVLMNVGLCILKRRL